MLIASRSWFALFGQANGNLIWLVLYVLFPVLLLLLVGFLSWSLKQRQSVANKAGDSSSEPLESSSSPQPTVEVMNTEAVQRDLYRHSPAKNRNEVNEQDQQLLAREPDFSDFDFADDSTEIELDSSSTQRQRFDLAAPENTEFDLHGGEQEDLLDEMYREDEQLSNSNASFHADDTDVEEGKSEQPPAFANTPKFHTHDEFSVEDDDLDLSDDTEQDFDTSLEFDSSASDSFGMIGSIAKDKNPNVLDDDEEKRRHSGNTPEDTAVGLDVSELELVDETLQLLESANAELEKLKRLNRDLLDDRTYLNARLQENEELVGELKRSLHQSQDENIKLTRVVEELREKSEALQNQIRTAKDSPSELQTKLLSELQTELVETQNLRDALESQLKTVTLERDRVREKLSYAELAVPESVVAELQLLTEQVERLKAERDETLRKTTENGKPE